MTTSPMLRPTAPGVDAPLFRRVIGNFASGVSVITSTENGVHHGATVSALSSLSMEPPMLLVCLHRDSATGAVVSRTGRFAVNILCAGQAGLARHFAVSAKGAGDQFSAVPTIDGHTGQLLILGALAHVECTVESRVTGGTHTVFLARVESGAAYDGEPLTYFGGRFGRFLEHQS